jgi:hypothetical protein
MVAKNKKSKKSSKGGAGGAPAAPIKVPENFSTIIYDMCNDLSTTFPEYAQQWQIFTRAHHDTMEESVRTAEIQRLFEYCLAVFPERFFDILYKNQEIFLGTGPEVNTKFLPNVDFRILFNCEGVSENTQNVMWNYLQLILFTILGSVQDKSNFGDSKNIFDGIDEQDLFAKLSETMENMTEFFQSMESAFPTEAPTGAEANAEAAEGLGKEGGVDAGAAAAEDGSVDSESDQEEEDDTPGPFKMPKFPKIPDIKELHQHLKSLFDGKIGSLAKELAEEITGDLGSLLGDDMKDVKTTKDVLQFLMKDPKKVTGIIQKITEKLKKKMSSGEISQEELMKEATDLLGKMKDMGGGMDQFKDMFKNMGIPIPKNAKIDMNALNRMTSHQSLRERLKKRMMDKQRAQQEAIQKMASSLQAAASATGTDQTQDIYELSRQLGLNLDSNEGVATGHGLSGAPKKGKKGKK